MHQITFRIDLPPSNLTFKSEQINKAVDLHKRLIVVRIILIRTISLAFFRLFMTRDEPFDLACITVTASSQISSPEAAKRRTLNLSNELIVGYGVYYRNDVKG